MERGIVDGVYSNEPSEVDFRWIENEDIGDESCSQEYWRNIWLIEHGCYTNITGVSVPEFSLTPKSHRFSRLKAGRGLYRRLGFSPDPEDLLLFPSTNIPLYTPDFKRFFLLFYFTSYFIVTAHA